MSVSVDPSNLHLDAGHSATEGIFLVESVPQDTAKARQHAKPKTAAEPQGAAVESGSAFIELRKARVECEYLRGTNRGHQGFWVIETCAAEDYKSLSFLGSNTLPTTKRIAEAVFSFNDFTKLGISGKGCKVKAQHEDGDYHLYIVTAKVMGIRP